MSVVPGLYCGLKSLCSQPEASSCRSGLISVTLANWSSRPLVACRFLSPTLSWNQLQQFASSRFCLFGFFFKKGNKFNFGISSFVEAPYCTRFQIFPFHPNHTRLFIHPCKPPIAVQKTSTTTTATVELMLSRASYEMGQKQAVLRGWKRELSGFCDISKGELFVPGSHSLNSVASKRS